MTGRRTDARCWRGPGSASDSNDGGRFVAALSGMVASAGLGPLRRQNGDGSATHGPGDRVGSSAIILASQRSALMTASSNDRARPMAV